MATARSPAEQGPPGLLNRACYTFLWGSLKIAFRLYFRCRVENAPRLDGPYVVVANHTSFLDPLLLCCAQRRRIAFMMSEVYYRSPRSGWVYRMARAIPVSLRGGNKDAIRAARAALVRGDVIGVFPEGGISRDGRPYLGHAGAVSLVLSTGVPVIPAGVTGAHEALSAHAGWPKPSRITIKFGAPIAPEKLTEGADQGRKARLANATERIMTEIAGLCGETAREVEVARPID